MARTKRDRTIEKRAFLDPTMNADSYIRFYVEGGTDRHRSNCIKIADCNRAVTLSFDRSYTDVNAEASLKKLALFRKMINEFCNLVEARLQPEKGAE